MSERTGIWIIRPEAAELGRRLAELLPGDLYCPWQIGDRTAHLSPGSQKDMFVQEFLERRQWVMVMATGIAVRFLNGLAADKKTDPAVVVVDEGGHQAISLLSGHEGGANDLAYRVANVLGATPVVTTATEALKPLVLGIGCRKGVSADIIEQVVTTALGNRSLSAVRLVATVSLKENEPGLLEFCRRHELPLRIFEREIVASRPWVSSPSSWVEKNTGAPGICEPCALMSSSRGRLVVPKFTADGVAVAVVEDGLRFQS